jgi:NUMOD4 motif/HNH endonuclease
MQQLSFDDLETWKPVPGWEGFYEVSDHGRVRGVDRIIQHGKHAWTVRGKILAACMDGHGYYLVNLYRDSKPTKRNVHVLVAAAFLGPCPPGMEVRHGPKGKLDNAPANLSYGTRVENCQDRRRDGTHLEGTRLPQAKLTEAIVRECRLRYAGGGVTMRSLADEFGVSLTAIWRALHGTCWKHVTT